MSLEVTNRKKSITTLNDFRYFVTSFEKLRKISFQALPRSPPPKKIFWASLVKTQTQVAVGEFS